MNRLLLEFGHVLLPATLGLFGVYLLLPQARRRPGPWRSVGLLLCLAAVFFLAGWSFARYEAVLPEKLLFYSFAGLAILGGGLLITQKNPVHAAISFALVVLSTCGLFLLLGAPFLTAATIVVYAGAIIVTFLFVIMLAQQSGVSAADQRSREPFLASLAGFVLLGALLCVLQRNYGTQELNRLLTEVKLIADASSVEEVMLVMGDPKQRKEDFQHPLVVKLEPLLPGVDAVTNLEADWQTLRAPGQLKRVKADARAILEAGERRRATLGAVPPGDVPVTTFAGVVPEERLGKIEQGKLPEGLKARNVASLGTALYTDHLAAIEIAGMLLLVATIGAIAIAGRAGTASSSGIRVEGPR